MTPPSPMALSRLETAVWGSERLGTWSAPTEFGVIDVTPLVPGGHWFVVLVEFTRVGRHDSWVCSGDNADILAKALLSPGSHAPIDPMTVRKIKDDISIVLPIFLARWPG